MQKKELLIGLILGVAIVFLVSQYVVDRRMKSIDQTISKEISKQIELTTEFEALLARGAVTNEVEKLIPGCPVEQMMTYDTLLSNLDKGLPYTDLQKLKELFSVCGNVAAVRRSVMTLLLAEKVEGMTNLITLKEVAKFDGVKYQQTVWQELAKKEQTISQLFVSLVNAQESIIVALLNNVPATSITVENIRASAQTLREEMLTLTEEVSVLRSSLVNS